MATETPARPSLSAPLRWLLVASLALNLLVAGLVLGDLLSHGGPGGRGPHRMEMTLGPFARALDEADRRAILSELRDRPDLGPPGPDERAAAFAEIVAAIRSEPFDRARADEALSVQAERVAGTQRAIREVLVARIAAMAPEERAEFADRLETELERGPRHDH